MQVSFAAGELAPGLHARKDLERFDIGARLLKNFITHPTGGASNRAGFPFIGEAGDSTAAVRLIEFEYNDEQTYMLEFGDSYLRVLKDGAQVVETAEDVLEASSGVDNTTTMGMRIDGSVPGTWAVGKHVFIVTASGSVYGPYLIDSISSPDVELTELDGSVPNVLSQAANLADLKTAGTQMELVYQITSPFPASVIFDVVVTQSADTMTLTHPSYAPRELTRSGHASWSFSTPTLTVTGLSPSSLFGAANKYPAACAYHQQRLMLGNINNQVNGNWGSKVGSFHDFTVGSPAADDDGISFILAERKVNAVRHYVSLEDLIVFTSTSPWRITGTSSEALTPSSINGKPQGALGCAKVPPIVVNDTVLFLERNARAVYDFEYTINSNKYKAFNRSILANHLFRGYTIVDWAWHQQDDDITVLWCVRSDGVLLGMTYVPEHDVWGWHRHELGGDGIAESVAVVTENGIERLYAVVRRTINSRTVRYIERMHTREFTDAADAVFLDSALCLENGGSELDTIYGLEWLEGETVGIVVEGRVQPQQVVQNGQLSVSVGANERVCIGLPYDADLQPLPYDPRNSVGKRKGVSTLTLRVLNSRGVKVGSSADDLIEIPDTILYYDTAPELYTGDLRVTIAQGWDDHGEVYIRQSHPLPVTILALVPDMGVGA